MKPVLVAVVFGAFLLALHPTGVTAADRVWVEAKSAHFTVMSDTGEKTARKVAWQFEQVRAAIQSIYPWARQAEMNKPILIFAVGNEVAMRALAPQFWEQRDGVRPSSLWAPGPDRNYIVVRTDQEPSSQGNINPYISAYWSYSALVIRTSFARDLPLWFVRGLASVISNTVVRESSIDIGFMIPWHVRQLRTRSKLRLAELLRVEPNSPWLVQADKLPTFEAESWAFMNFLLFGDEGKHRAQLDQFLTALLDGKPSATALDVAFRDLDPLEQAFFAYIRRDLFQYAHLNIDLNVKSEGFATRALSAGESAAIRAALHASMERPVEARALLEEARKADANLATASEVEGVLLDAEGKAEEARGVYAKAIELHSTNFYAHYRWAVLTARPDATPEMRARVEQAADRAASLNGNFAPAYALLASVKLQGGRPGEALTAIERAVSLESGQVQHRIVLARVLLALSRPDEAQQQAREAAALASTVEERRDARQVMDAVERALAPARTSSGSTPAAGGSPANQLTPSAPRAGNGVQAPTVIAKGKPQYTPEALREKIEGSVLIDCVVRVTGECTDVRVVRSLDSLFGLDAQAVKSIGDWRFEPGTRAGVPVPVLVSIEVTFTLGK
jgi:TonB family protein